MIFYMDTSALVKLYVSEPGSARARSWSGEASGLVTSLVTYAEARAAFARMHRLGAITRDALREVVTMFDHDWSRCQVIGIDDALVRRAGGLAERHVLRGYDAIQLASALEARPGQGSFVFASFDDRLNRAAVREHLDLPPQPELVAERAHEVPRRRRA